MTTYILLVAVFSANAIGTLPALRVVVALVALASSGCTWLQRVSVDSAGHEGNGNSGDLATLASASPGLSADGRYIAFESDSPGLVVGDRNDWTDVFVRDRTAGTTERVSVGSAAVPGNGDSGTKAVAISANGRFVAFNSLATDLAGLPPAYVTAMEFDPLRDEGILYALRLMEAGVSVELHAYPGTFHGSAVVQTAAVSRRATQELLVALARGLGVTR